MRPLAPLVLALLLGGCFEGPGPGGGDPATGESVAFRSLLHQVDQPILEGPLAREISEAEWASAWEDHAASTDPRPQRPHVDFARERLVAVALRQHGSGCHDVKVESIERAATHLVVRTVEYDGEQPGFACTAQVVWPLHVVAFVDEGTPLRFEARVVTDSKEWSRPTVEPTGTAEVETLSTRSLDRGSFSGIHEDTRELLRDSTAFEATWMKHRSDEPVPSVEFPNESVVVVVEHGPTGCFGIHVGNVTYDSGARLIRVEVFHEETPESVNCTVAIQDAYEFVAIPDRPGRIAFVDVGAPRNETAKPDPAPGPSGPETLAKRDLARGAQSGLPSTRALVRDAATFAQLWEQHSSRASDPSAPPAVEWGRESVLIVVLDDKPNGCWGVEIGKATWDEGEIVVEVDTIEPPPDAFCTSVVTQPFHVVAIPARDGDARFVG